jgi:cell division inhibitor SepF
VARASPRRASSDRAPSGRTAVVRPLPGAGSKPFVVAPASFNDAQEVADKFKINVPVILNLQGVERDLARRIIDFASGLCYGLGGQMERVANQVYLLTPSDVEVSPEERRRLHERGYES